MDLIFNWRTLALSYGLWSALWLGGPALDSGGNVTYGTWGGFVSLACAFLPIMMICREDKFKAWTLACSLPATRNTIVASRYLGGWLVAVAGVALAIAAMAVLSVVGIRPLLPPTPMLPVIILAVIGVTIALMMPLPLRFGVAGVIMFLVVLRLAGISLVVASALFHVPAMQFVESAVKGAFTAAAQMRAALGAVAFSAVLLLTVAALNGASYGLSAWIYRRRDF